MPRKAKNLKEALNILDPEHVLSSDEELNEWFVSRPNSPLEDLAILLKNTGPQKVLFTGHRGSGKSTELAKLAQELKDDFFIIRFSVMNVLNMFDLTYVDVILSLGLELIKNATDPDFGGKIKEELLVNILNFAKDITQEVEMGEKMNAGIGAELN